MGVIEKERIDIPQYEGRKPLKLVAENIITESKTSIAFISIEKSKNKIW